MPGECQRLQKAMLEWAAEQRAALVYDGTLRSLWHWYLSAEDSPFRKKRPSTQKSYKAKLKAVIALKGELLIEDLTGAQVLRWFRDMQDNGGLSIGTAYTTINILKAVLMFGASNGKEDCEKLRSRLRETRFETPERRDAQFTYEHLQAFLAASDRPSMSLGVSLQFWLGMRQKDVIGEWLQVPGADGIRDHNGLRWGSGLTGLMFDADGYFRKKTTKTGARVEHTITHYPELAVLVKPALERSRGGPLVVNEMTGQPYHATSYGENFRRIKRAAGIPEGVWNMDARAGAITQALEAGAHPNDVQMFAGHAQLQTTMRYNRSVRRQSARVAKRRVEGGE